MYHKYLFIPVRHGLIFLLFVTGLASRESSAQPVLSDETQHLEPCGLKLTTDAPPQKLQILETFHFRYLVSYESHCQIDVVPLAHDALSCDKPFVQTHFDSETSRLVSTVDLTCRYQRPGVFYPMPVQWTVIPPDPSSETRITPPPARILVTAFDPEFDPSTPMTDWLKLHPWQGSTVHVILFSILGILLGGGGLFLLITMVEKKRKLRRALKHPEIISTPIETFIADITELVDFTPSTLAEHKIYHDQLSSALRKLLSSLFMFDAMSMTTAQLCDRLKQNHVPAEHIEELKRILGKSDRIKFALETSSQAVNLMILRDASQLASLIHDFAQTPASTSPQDCSTLTQSAPIPQDSDTISSQSDTPSLRQTQSAMDNVSPHPQNESERHVSNPPVSPTHEQNKP